MRYLRTQTINRRSLRDARVGVDLNNGVVMGTTFALTLPKGTTDQRPGSTAWTNGMIRYNTTTDQVEVRQNDNWRSLQFKESNQITQTTLGIGDFLENKFPLPNGVAYPAMASGATWSGANLIVVVENVLQLHNTNYTIDTNPTGNSPSTGVPYPAGDYIVFSDAVPLGKPVVVIVGFDQ